MLPIIVQDVLRIILQATRTNSRDSSTDISACQALRSNIATNMPTWLTALPISEQQLVKDYVFILMAELEYLQPGDRVAIVNTTLSAFEQSKTHCCALLDLVPACLVLITAGKHMLIHY
eukprot:jgi/Chrzof1/11319/Cz05g32100.t1